ncbi:MAG: hypothetical protein M1325_02000 [Actinobacteria bacterium]|nr:hypothetical protein [Actinomycetota bacterium]
MATRFSAKNLLAAWQSIQVGEWYTTTGPVSRRPSNLSNMPTVYPFSTGKPASVQSSMPPA